MLYERFGKIAWGVSSVYLRLKKLNIADNNENTLEERMVERDLGEIVEAKLKSRRFNLTPRKDPNLTAKILQINLHKSKVTSAEVLLN